MSTLVGMAIQETLEEQFGRDNGEAATRCMIERHNRQMNLNRFIWDQPED